MHSAHTPSRAAYSQHPLQLRPQHIAEAMRAPPPLASEAKVVPVSDQSEARVVSVSDQCKAQVSVESKKPSVASAMPTSPPSIVSSQIITSSSPSSLSATLASTAAVRQQLWQSTPASPVTLPIASARGLKDELDDLDCIIARLRSKAAREAQGLRVAEAISNAEAHHERKFNITVDRVIELVRQYRS